MNIPRNIHAYKISWKDVLGNLPARYFSSAPHFLGPCPPLANNVAGRRVKVGGDFCRPPAAFDNTG